MKFVLAYTICSAITGFCNNTLVHPIKFDTWSECTIGGAKVIMEVNEEYREKFNDKKLYISYFCNEVPIEKTPV